MAARAAQDQRAAVGHADDGVVGSRLDRAVVDQEQVGDLGEPLAGVVVLVRDRLVRDVAAREHERLPQIRHQQVVERRVRQHHPELRRPGRDRRRDRGVRTPRREHDRAHAAREQLLVQGRREDQLARRREARRHQREGLVLAMLARAQLGHRDLVARKASEVEAADALHRHDRAVAQRARCGLERVERVRIHERAAAGPGQRHARAAVRAGVRLGVKTPVRRVVVLGPAGRAHREAGHCGVRPVVGDVAHDREAGAAVGAVGERVAKAPVGGVEQLGEAVGAGGAVGRDRGARLAAGRALPDREAELAELLERLGHHPLDRGERRRLGGQAGEEALDRLARGLDLDHHAARVVQHVAGEPHLVGQPVHVGAEAHALDRPLDPRTDAAHATSSRSTWYALACASWMRGMCSERVITTWSASCSAATRPPS